MKVERRLTSHELHHPALTIITVLQCITFKVYSFIIIIISEQFLQLIESLQNIIHSSFHGISIFTEHLSILEYNSE